MKTNLNYSPQPHAHAHRRAGSALPAAAPLASSTRYTCPMHPEIARDESSGCPECGMTLIPIFEAIARAAMALRSLSVLTNALRLNRV
ncbi:MAG: heavy metal-binding domain-containing protein [Burkholderiales bacterium]